MVLSTLGYQGTNLDSFIEFLKRNEIKVLIDVRENPISRKKGFSKNSLRKAVVENEINYVHFPALGSEREIRKEYRITKDWEKFSVKYNEYLNSRNEDLNELTDLIDNNHCCLMCFEADYHLCHRSIITDVLKDEYNKKIIINHLALEKKEALA